MELSPKVRKPLRHVFLRPRLRSVYCAIIERLAREFDDLSTNRIQGLYHFINNYNQQLILKPVDKSIYWGTNKSAGSPRHR